MVEARLDFPNAIGTELRFSLWSSDKADADHKEYLCMPIFWSEYTYGKIYALILSAANAGATACQRAGLLQLRFEFWDEQYKEDLWQRRTLKLISASNKSRLA